MSLLIWNPALQVNIKDIDEQHKEMLELANVFYQKLYIKAPENEILESLHEFSDYTISHFRFEENLFKKYPIANNETHTKEHEIFITDLTKLNARVKNNDLVVSVELIEFLRNAIINHIFVTDREMARYILKIESNPN
jgi:hemerythrin-like metal-binding protein